MNSIDGALNVALFSGKPTDAYRRTNRRTSSSITDENLIRYRRVNKSSFGKPPRCIGGDRFLKNSSARHRCRSLDRRCIATMNRTQSTCSCRQLAQRLVSALCPREQHTVELPTPVVASDLHAANRLHAAAESLSMIINRLSGIPAKAARIRSAMRLVLTPTTYPTKVPIIADQEKYASVRFSEYGGIHISKLSSRLDKLPQPDGCDNVFRGEKKSAPKIPGRGRWCPHIRTPRKCLRFVQVIINLSRQGVEIVKIK